MENWATSNKTDQLNADDFVSGPQIITIERVEVHMDDTHKLWIFHNDQQGRSYKPCLTVRKLLQVGWGTDTAEWGGRQLELFRDKTVVFGKSAVGGIRLSRMSHIDKDVHEQLNLTRGKRGSFTVKPLLPDVDYRASFKHVVSQGDENNINRYLVSIGWLTEGETNHQIQEKYLPSIIDNPGSFLAAVHDYTTQGEK
jgi:hypothetical protein